MSVYRLAFLMRGYFDGGLWASWTGRGSLDWDGVTYLSDRGLLSVEDASAAQQGALSGCAFTLSGLSSEALALARGEEIAERRIEIDLALLDASWAVTSVVPWFRGSGELVTIRTAPDSASIRLTAEPRTLDFRRPRAVRLTKGGFGAIHFGETGFDLLASGVERTLEFGRVAA